MVIVASAALLSSCSTLGQNEEAAPTSTRREHFHPCYDVSTEFRERNNLAEPEAHGMYYSDHPKPSDRKGIECVYSTIQGKGDDYSLSVAVANSFIPKKPTYQIQEFEYIQIAGRTGQLGCVTEGVYQKPYCDIKVQLKDTQVWFNLRYDYPKESIAASEAVTRAKVTELATQIVAEIPPDR